MKDVEIAWVAGLFEGEGTFSFNRTGISLGLTSTDRDVLEKLLFITGVGKIYNKKKRLPHHKEQWFWNVGKKSDVKPLIEAMLPYLGKRRTARAIEALEFCKYLANPHERDPICSIDGCGDKHKANGLCQYHYNRVRNNRVRVNKRPTKKTTE